MSERLEKVAATKEQAPTDQGSQGSRKKKKQAKKQGRTEDPTLPLVRNAVQRSFDKVERETSKNLDSLRRILNGTASEDKKQARASGKRPKTGRQPGDSSLTDRTNRTSRTHKSLRTTQGRSVVTTTTARSGKSILKNPKNKRNMYGDTSSNAITLQSPSSGELKKHKVTRTNVVLPTRSWSVSSFDSCGGDTRRNYKQYLEKNAKSGGVFNYRNGFNLGVFVGKNDADHPLPRKLSSHYVDDEPYGPTEPESLSNGKEGKGILKAVKSIGNILRSNSKNNDSKPRNKGISTLRTLRGRRKNVTVGEKNKKTNKSLGSKKRYKLSMELDPKPKPAVNHQEQGDHDDSTVIFDETYPEEKTIDNFERTSSGKPQHIPVDMIWDKKRKKLVNKPIPDNKLPPGKQWSPRAKDGLGGVVNKPPHIIPPNKIWSISAFNGQGGIVNKCPAKIPKGKYWDVAINDGLGGLVSIKGWTKQKSRHINKKEKKCQLEADLTNDRLARKQNVNKQNGTKKAAKSGKKTIRTTKSKKPKIGLLEKLEQEAELRTKDQEEAKKVKEDDKDSVNSVKSRFSVASIIHSVSSKIGLGRRRIKKQSTATSGFSMRNTLRKGSSFFRKSRNSQVSLASTQIMDEAGLEFGHVHRLYEKFERISLGDKQFDDFYNDLDKED